MAEQKLPPQDLEAEKSLLGAVLIDVEAMLKVADIVRDEHFYGSEHKLIFKAMRELYEANKPIDVVTLTSQLKKNGDLKKVGGSAKLAELANESLTAANVATYATIVKEMATRRRLISLGAEMTEMGFDESKPVTDLMDSVEQEIFKVSSTQEGKSFVHIKDTLEESFNRI